MQAVDRPDITSPIVLAVGGSLISPNGIDTEFVSHLKAVLGKHIAEGYQFVIVTGGGKLARTYQEALKTLAVTEESSRDWIGVYATHVNAQFMRLVFGDAAGDEIITDPTTVSLPLATPVVVAGGWKPGWSTDYVAVQIARQLGSTVVVNLTNVAYVYTKDPNKFSDAEPLYTATWDELKDIVPDTWTPGAQVPFDPRAIEEASDLGLTVVALGGASLDSLSSYLASGEVSGTIIHS